MEIHTNKVEVASSTSVEDVPVKDASESKASSPKSESPSRPSSPPPNCAICLGQCKNKSFTDTCLHQFCFKCLVTWSKVKPECPLCKQTFKSIIYNVKSNQHYDEYLVEPSNPPEAELIDMDYFEGPRFRYRTTLTLHRHEGLALERLLMRLPVMPPPPPSIHPSYPPITRRSRRSTNFRQSVYRHNLWANPLPDVTGRHRECSPEFYRENPAQIHRLLPWLQRELSFLLPGDERVISRILTLLPVSPILSTHFREMLFPLLLVHTDHFLHEFYSYATSPYDMIGYDRAVQYVPEASRPPVTYVNEILSTDSDSNDSDIMLVSPTTTTTSVGALTNEPSTSNGLNSFSNSVIAIETMSHSDTEDSSDEVVMVGYVKPPHERTPEVVDLASDSDTMVIEDERICSPIEVIDDLPSTTVSSVPTSFNHSMEMETPSTSGLVKIKLKRNDNASFQTISPGSDSDNGEDVVPLRRRKYKTKRKHNKSRFSSRDSASTEDTDRDTDIDMDLNKIKSKVLQHSDYSEDCDSDYSDNKDRRLCKRKQTLASNILKKFKMSTTSQQGREGGDIDAGPSTSAVNIVLPANKSTPRKSKHKKNLTEEPLPLTNSGDSKKLKIKGRSKSKEKLINKIFENRQVNDSTTKSVDSSKAKVKNKLFNKSFNKHLDPNVPSTSKAHTTQHSDCDSTDETTNSSQSPDNLLDILSKSILKPNNSLLSINEHSQSSTHNTQVPSDVKHLLNEIAESVFCQSSPLNLSCRDQSSE